MLKTLILNAVLIPLLQLTAAKVALVRPGNSFQPGSALYRTRGWEGTGHLYQRLFMIRAWKGRLPDGGRWLGSSFRKDRLHARNETYFSAFLTETCRAEWAHWISLSCAPIFWAWNPPWACAAITAYMIAANLPCIVVQRHNRASVVRIMEKRRDLELCAIRN